MCDDHRRNMGAKIACKTIFHPNMSLRQTHITVTILYIRNRRCELFLVVSVPTFGIAYYWQAYSWTAGETWGLKSHLMIIFTQISPSAKTHIHVAILRSQNRRCELCLLYLCQLLGMHFTNKHIYRLHVNFWGQHTRDYHLSVEYVPTQVCQVKQIWVVKKSFVKC